MTYHRRMATKKAPPRRPTARPIDADRLTVRGLSEEDRKALDAYTAKRREELEREGASVSQNTVARALLRDALRAVGAYALAGVSESAKSAE